MVKMKIVDIWIQRKKGKIGWYIKQKTGTCQILVTFVKISVHLFWYLFEKKKLFNIQFNCWCSSVKRVTITNGWSFIVGLLSTQFCVARFKSPQSIERWGMPKLILVDVMMPPFAVTFFYPLFIILFNRIDIELKL